MPVGEANGEHLGVATMHVVRTVLTRLLAVGALLLAPLLAAGGIAGASGGFSARVPLSSQVGGVAVNTVTNKIYVTNMADSTVSVLDGTTNLPLAKPITVGHRPTQIAVNVATNKIYVGNYGDGTVTVINGVTDHVVGAPIRVGMMPEGIAVNPVTNRIYVVNYGESSISVINGATDLAIGSPHEIAGGCASVAVNPVTNLLYVTLQMADAVAVVDGTTLSLLTHVSLAAGDGPVGVAVNSVTNKIYVTSPATGGLSEIDGVTNVATLDLPVGGHPWFVAVNQITNKVFTTDGSGSKITVTDGATHATSTIEVGDPQSNVAVNPATNMIYAIVADGSMVVINGTYEIPKVTTVGVGDTPFSPVVNPVTKKVYVANRTDGTVSVLDEATNHALGNPITVGNLPNSICIDTSLNLIYVALLGDAAIRVINGADDQAGATITVPRGPSVCAVNPVTHQVFVASSINPGIAVIDGVTQSVVGSVIPTDDWVPGLAVNPVTNLVYATNYGTGTVTVINGSDASVVTTINLGNVGAVPYGIAVNPDTNKIFVVQTAANQMALIDGASNAITASVAVASYSGRVAVDPATNTVYDASYLDKSVTAFDGTSLAQVGSPVALDVPPREISVDSLTGAIYVGSASSTHISTFSGARAPAAPTVGSYSVSSKSLSVSWTPPTSGAGALSGYVIGATPRDGNRTIFQRVGPLTTSATFTGLTNGVDYDISIVAINQFGAGQPSPKITLLVGPAVASLSSFVSEVSINTGVQFTWPDAVPGASPVLFYVVSVNGASSLLLASQTSYTATGLTNGTSYDVSVTPLSAEGLGNTISASIYAGTAPSAPKKVKATSNANSRSVITWKAPAQTGGFTTATGLTYSVSVAQGPSYSSWAPLAGCTNLTVLTCTALTLINGQNYKFKVTAINPIGTSATAGTSNVATPKAVSRR